MKYKLTFALVAALTSTAFAEFKALLPEFKNEKQLAEWRAEQSSKPTSQGYAAEETAFYTGKPYLASAGEYAFKYRSYSPELARWTSEDPSGFPDGANGGSYAPIPTCAYDPDGLKAHLAFENKIQNVSLTVYVHDHTAQNFTQAGSMAAWKAAVETAWTFSGTDQSNGEKLSFKTTISFRLQSGGTLNQSGALLQYDNVVKFTDATNLPSQVIGHQIGVWQFGINDQTVVHEVGHFMMGDDQYTESFPGGVRNVTPYNTEDLGDWRRSIMGGGGSINATRLDANHILQSLGETVHLFE
jgi:RHS repeat-associated protein